MNLRGNTLTLNADSVIDHGVAFSAELGWEAVPCLILDGFTILVPDAATIHRLLCEAARLDAGVSSPRSLVATGDAT